MATSMPSRLAGLCSEPADAVPDGVENGVVDHRWLRETVTAVHDPVTHRGQAPARTGIVCSKASAIAVSPSR